MKQVSQIGKYEIPNISDNWVKKIFVDVTTNVAEAGYSPSDSLFDRKLKVFNSITLSLNQSVIYQDDLLPLVMHELIHAYQDYNLKINGNSLDKKFLDKGYNKNKLPEEPDEYKQEIEAQELMALKYELSWLLYHFNDFERSAYISQITGYLKNCDKKFTKINDIMEYLRDTLPYENYETVFEWGDDFINLSYKEKQKQVMNWINEISNLKFRNYNDFVRWIKYKTQEYRCKFDCIIPKIAYQHLKMRRFTYPATTHLIKLKG